MILDSSAVVAIFLREPGHELLLSAIAEATTVGVSAPTLVETGIVLSARLERDARPLLAEFMRGCGAEVLDFTDGHWREAVQAWLRFGKGRHPAGLNFGDCVSYATARLAGQPLLCVGEDFRQTDLSVV